MEIEEKKRPHGSGRKKAELEKIIEYRTKGAILRAKCRWHNAGEKKHKVFSISREKAF